MTDQYKSVIDNPVPIDSQIDAILHIACSDEWATMVINGYNQIDDDEVITVEVLLNEADGWGHVSQMAKTLRDQLNGGDPKFLLSDTPKWKYQYALGVDEKRAERIADRCEKIVEMGAHGHQLRFNLHHSTCRHLVAQLASQIDVAGVPDE